MYDKFDEAEEKAESNLRAREVLEGRQRAWTLHQLIEMQHGAVWATVRAALEAAGYCVQVVRD